MAGIFKREFSGRFSDVSQVLSSSEWGHMQLPIPLKHYLLEIIFTLRKQVSRSKGIVKIEQKNKQVDAQGQRDQVSLSF